jgi:pimeloyl-ACP methyl ester carboxylesterase
VRRYAKVSHRCATLATAPPHALSLLLKHPHALTPAPLAPERRLCQKAASAPHQLRHHIHDIRGRHSFDFRSTQTFLRETDVVHALGMHGKESAHWRTCDKSVFATFSAADQLSREPVMLVSNVLAAGVRVLVYAGDADYETNWIGVLSWMLQMTWQGQRMFNQARDQTWDDVHSGRSLGIFRSAAGLTFVRVDGAGHNVMIDKPQAAQQMAHQWMLNMGQLRSSLGGSLATAGDFEAPSSGDDDVLS